MEKNPRWRNKIPWVNISRAELKYSVICALIDNYTIMKKPKYTPKFSEEFSILYFSLAEVLPTQPVWNAFSFPGTTQQLL